MAKIVGGLQLEDVLNGGTVFEIEPNDKNPDSDNECKGDEYIDAVKDFVKLDCIDQEEEENFLEPFELIAAKMINLIPDGKVKKRVIREGCGLKPQPSSIVKIHYNAYVEHEAIPFDSTYSRKKPFTFVMGEGGVIEGLEIAVSSMQTTEKALFLIHPELAYKDSGLDRIPPNATVLFEVEVGDIMVTQPEETIENAKEFSSVYKYCLALCTKSKKLCQLQDFSGAAKEYDQAAKKMENVLLENYEEQVKSSELLLKIYTNLVICYTHLQQPKRGCYVANKIFDIARGEKVKLSPKLYFNNAKCLKMLGNYELAEKRLKFAQKLEPRNPEIARELEELERCKQEDKNRDRVFGKALVGL